MSTRALHQEVSSLLGGDGDAILKEAVQLLQEMIRNACVNLGDGECQEIRSINTLSRYLDSYGLSYVIHHHPQRPNRPNLLAEYGSGSPRVMLGPSHVDVVPVRTDDEGKSYPNWDVPPFEGIIKDDYIYGRGAVDMLSTVAVQAVIYAKIAKAKVPLKGTLLFCAVSDEEAGGLEGVGFFLKDPVLQKVFRTDYAMTEIGGATLIDRHRQPTKNYIQSNSEKGLLVVTITCTGRPGHGSMPLAADNALSRASEVIDRISKYWAPTVITSAWCDLAWHIDAPWLIRFCLTNRWLAALLIRLLIYINNPLGPVAHAMTRCTLSPNHVTGTLKRNVVPGHARVEIDCRLMPGQDVDYVRPLLKQALGHKIYHDKEHYDISLTEYLPATVSSVDTPLWRAMEESAKILVPEAKTVRIMVPGATDARFYRPKGSIVYGANLFEPSFDFGTMGKCIHGDNERISITSLFLSLQFYGLAVKKMMIV